MVMLYIFICFFSTLHGMQTNEQPTIEHLFKAIEHDKVHEACGLIKNNPELITIVDEKEGIYPIHKAAQKGSISILTYLVNQGSDIDKKDYWGKTALMIGAENGNCEVVKQCVVQGANVYLKDIFYHTALAYAIYHGHKKIVKFLIQEDPSRYFIDQKPYYSGKIKATGNFLTLAAMQGHTKIVKWLLRSDVPVAIQDPYDSYHLQAAAKGDYFIIASLLLAYGADVNGHGKDMDFFGNEEEEPSKDMDFFGNEEEEPMALLSAVFESNIPMVELLLSYGADSEKKYNGRNSLELAQERGNKKMVDLLRHHVYRSLNCSLSATDALSNTSLKDSAEA